MWFISIVLLNHLELLTLKGSWYFVCAFVILFLWGKKSHDDLEFKITCQQNHEDFAPVLPVSWTLTEQPARIVRGFFRRFLGSDPGPGAILELGGGCSAGNRRPRALRPRRTRHPLRIPWDPRRWERWSRRKNRAGNADCCEELSCESLLATR